MEKVSSRFLGVLAGAAVLCAAGCTTILSEGVSPAGEAALADAVAASLVKVEYTLQYDKGEGPQYGSRSLERLISQQRPLEVSGFLLSAKGVVTPDIPVHRRFIKAIAVRYGQRSVPARVSAYAERQDAVFLELASPLEGAVPLDFSKPTKPPYFAIAYGVDEAKWVTQVRAMPTMAAVSEDGRRLAPAPSNCLIVCARGRPAGVSMTDGMPLDDSWKGSPAKWPAVSAEQMECMTAELKAKTDQSLLRVSLSFRSPMKSAVEMLIRRRGSDEEEATERNVPGILVGSDRVLVLVNLPARLTARLERIVVHGGEGQAVPATFAGTLSDYGCFLAALDQPLASAVKLSKADIFSMRSRLLLAVEMLIQGERRVTYYHHGRIPSFDLGWKRHVYPETGGWSDSLFYFTGDGELVALPLARRQKVAAERWEEDQPVLTAASYVGGVLADLKGNLDTSNVPVSEEQENRLAWLGVELQPLNKELARINNVSDLTRDGQMGAIVSYVYQGSPAAAAGIKPGYALLRLHVEGEPRPLEVRIEDFGFGGGRAFPWDRLDEVPEQYFDQIPMPWPSADNTLNRQLTELGFGTKFTAEFFADGEVVTKDFQVVQGPRHYDSAARYKSDELGLTVRDMTYEVRRYFQKAPADSGVIVSKVEPGSKAAVSGIKPFEIVTQVNDRPVSDVGEFAKLIAGQGELRLEIKRMTKGRVVKIKMAAEKATPATGATAPAPTGEPTTLPDTAPAQTP